MSNWSKTMPNGEHEIYEQLCALSLTRELTVEESALLRGHISNCLECKRDLRQYNSMGKRVMPAIGAALEDTSGEVDLSWWSASEAREKLLADAHGQSRSVSRTRRGNLAKTGIHRQLLYAAAILLAVMGVAVTSYRLGRSGRNSVSVQKYAQPSAVPSESAATLIQATQQEAELEKLKAQLDRDRKTIEELTGRTKSLQERADREARDHASELTGLKASDAAEMARLSYDLATAKDELNAAQTGFVRLETEYARLKGELSQKDAQLETANARAVQADETAERQRQLLSSDRDIRELIGARDLLIADVFDLDSDGKKQQAFGRIFYTKKKSLIFYAFDLDQARGPREASYQAWGISGSSHDRPLSLGVLYLDNESNRRWALKIENPEQLAQLQAVFVTVEPKGGSKKPTGRQLLYASLRREPNHP